MNATIEVYHVGLPFMSFEILQDANLGGSLLMLDNAICLFKHRKDGYVTISAIISNEKGKGQKMLEYLKSLKSKGIIAKCPIDLQANVWYHKNGFVVKERQTTKSGRIMNVYFMGLSE